MTTAQMREDYENYSAYSVVEKILKLKVGQKLTLWSPSGDIVIQRVEDMEVKG